MVDRKIIWTKVATKQFNKAIEYIKLDSEIQADKVRVTILNAILNLRNASIVHRIDPLKKNNDGNYLYFELLHYRIVYYKSETEVFIIRIWHTKMEPKRY